MNHGMIEDLRRKMVTDLQMSLQRQVNIAQAVLDTHETTVLVLKVAADLLATAVLVPVQIRREGADASEMFDVFADQVRRMTADEKPTYLRVLAAHEKVAR